MVPGARRNWAQRLSNPQVQKASQSKRTAHSCKSTVLFRLLGDSITSKQQAESLHPGTMAQSASDGDSHVSRYHPLSEKKCCYKKDHVGEVPHGHHSSTVKSSDHAQESRGRSRLSMATHLAVATVHPEGHAGGHEQKQ